MAIVEGHIYKNNKLPAPPPGQYPSWAAVTFLGSKWGNYGGTSYPLYVELDGSGIRRIKKTADVNGSVAYLKTQGHNRQYQDLAWEFDWGRLDKEGWWGNTQQWGYIRLGYSSAYRNQLEAERLEAERLEAERLEAERLANLAIEAERLLSLERKSLGRKKIVEVIVPPMIAIDGETVPNEDWAERERYNSEERRKNKRGEMLTKEQWDILTPKERNEI